MRHVSATSQEQVVKSVNIVISKVTSKVLLNEFAVGLSGMCNSKSRKYCGGKCRLKLPTCVPPLHGCKTEQMKNNNSNDLFGA
jgi:hypothetical protein